MTPTEGQTTTPSGADVDLLAALERMRVQANYGRCADSDIATKEAIRQIDEDRAALTTVAALIARNAELEGALEFNRIRAADRDRLAAENKALRSAFPKPRVRCCMNCAEHGECNPALHGACGYDEEDADYDRGWNACLDAALARTPAKENDDG